MAKVKITGHASGTGVLTVTAPNTSTDRTITLPDSTGTLVDSTTAVTKDANGNVGIGVTPESWESKFKVLQVGRGGSIFSPDNNDELSLGSNIYTNTGGIEKYINTDTAAIHNIDTGKHTFKVAASGSADANITWTTGFEVLNDGKARAKNGLLFGTDTAAANALNDYEEGTWTPTLSGTSGGASGVTFDIRKAWYTKVGRQVNVSCYVGMTSWSSGPSGHAQIIGLPFAASNETGYFTTITTGYTLNFDTDNAPGGGFIEINTSAMRLIKRASDAARNNINNNVSCSALNGNEYIIASATYFTDS